MKQLIATAKRNCLLCSGYRFFKQEAKEQGKAREALNQLTDYFEGQYNMLRKEDASAEAISRALDNKRHCMNALTACRRCRREIDEVNRMLSLVK